MSKSPDADSPLRQQAHPAEPEAAPRRRPMSIASVALLLFSVITAATGQVMLKHGIPDLRLFYDNDVRFLEQFG